MAQDIRKGKGDYVLCLKKNHSALYAHVEQRFEFAERMGIEATRMGESFGHQRHHSTDGGHGRIEKRRVDTLDATGPWLHKAHPGWDSVQSIVRLTAHRTVGLESSEQTRYFVSSHPATEKRSSQVDLADLANLTHRSRV